MEHNQNQKSSLPENAYRELKDGEEYKSVIPASSIVPEVTPYSLTVGIIMAIIFSAAAAYSGLKIGQVFEAAIPISIIAVGLSTFLKKKNALSQNIIIQSIGACSGVIVAGAIFTIPGLYILQAKYPEIEVNFFQIFFSSMLGGFLGILFLIPFRKYFVKDMHGKFPFPEATATTEILITGEKGGSQAGILITSGLIGGVFEFLFSSVKLWGEKITSKILPYGDYLADKTKIIFEMSISPLVFSFGYLVGLKFSLIITVGSLLSWFVFIPLINQIGGIVAASGGTNPFDAMSAAGIFKEFVRPIGIGAIAMAGIIGIIKSSPVILSAVKLAVGGTGSKKESEEKTERTQLDIKMTFIMILAFFVIASIFAFLIIGVQVTVFQALVALATIVIISFLFTTVAANAIAIVGTNPVSGMTLMTLIVSSIVLVAVGLSGPNGMVSALVIGGIVCTALSMAGGFITDLKVGYWLGTTPKKQQQWKFLGTALSSATVGLVIYVLAQAYGFVYVPGVHESPLVAPQANAMAAVIEPLMLPGAKVYWMLYAIGAIISILMNWLGISPLAFALGMFIPLELNTPLAVGGLLAHFMGKSKKGEAFANARSQRGTLIASGFIAGAALFGVLGAFLLFFGANVDSGLWAITGPIANMFAGLPKEEIALNLEMYGQWVALIAFIGIVVYFVWDSNRAKPEDN